ncbi:exo-alpha-sialidase [Nonomuraea sp. NBC_00507]|uniref:sialidase family protein n=1 Tax=Nonomuraea sp. NBC_00507 TaxID=2976002 RepID=UPI002E176B6E
MTDPRFDGVLRYGGAFLPAPHGPDSHAANLLHTTGGDLLCTWFSGPEEGHPGTDVLLSGLEGDTWSEPQVIAADPARSEQNPVLFEADGTIWLLHTSSEPYDLPTAHVVARTSRDGGRTWSAPWVLFDRTIVRHPPLIRDDAWILPVYGAASSVMVSADHGETWAEHPVPGSEGLVQMTIADRGDGTLLGLFRSRRADSIYASVSADGLTWSIPEPTELPNNDSSVQLLALRDGRLALVYNHASLEQYRWVTKDGQRRKKALRTPLNVAVSADGGKSWPSRVVVRKTDDEYWDNEYGYSYPSVAEVRGRIHVAYSYLRKTIRHEVIAWPAGADGGGGAVPDTER